MPAVNSSSRGRTSAISSGVIPARQYEEPRNRGKQVSIPNKVLLGLRVQPLEHHVVLPSAGDFQVLRGHAVLAESGSFQDALRGEIVRQGLGLDAVQPQVLERDAHDIADGGGGEAPAVGLRADPVADAAGQERAAGDAAESDTADHVAGLVEDHVREPGPLLVTFERNADSISLAIDCEPAIVSQRHPWREEVAVLAGDLGQRRCVVEGDEPGRRGHCGSPAAGAGLRPWMPGAATPRTAMPTAVPTTSASGAGGAAWRTQC